MPLTLHTRTICPSISTHKFSIHLEKKKKKKRLTNQSIKLSEKSEKHREPEHDEPDDMNEKEGLAGERAGTTIADLTEPQLGNLDTGAKRVGAATPVSHAVDAAYRVGPETLDGAGCGSGSGSVGGAEIVSGCLFGG